MKTRTEATPSENAKELTYHRKPTQWEIKFGKRATHYKDFEFSICWNKKNNSPKIWLVCPIDGLRYYY